MGIHGALVVWIDEKWFSQLLKLLSQLSKT